MQARKISIADIQQMQRVLEAAAESPMEEFTRIEAIGMLAPQIHLLQSKGHNLRAIAGMLSDKGFAVTPVTLSSYLAKAAGRKKAARKPKAQPHAHPAAGHAATCAPSVAEAAKVSTVASKPRESGGGSASGEKVARSVVPAPASPAAGAELPRQGVSRVEEAAQRRSAFVPRKDSDVI